MLRYNLLLSHKENRRMLKVYTSSLKLCILTQLPDDSLIVPPKQAVQPAETSMAFDRQIPG